MYIRGGAGKKRERRGRDRDSTLIVGDPPAWGGFQRSACLGTGAHGMRQRRNKGRHHGRGRGEPACEIVVTPMTATAARTSRDGRHLRRCTSPCSRRRHRVSRMPYTPARTPLLGGEASAMLIEPCAVRASRQPLGTKFTAGSSTPRSTDDFDTPLEPPLARHASRRPRSGRVAPSRRATRGQPSPRAGGAGAVESLESQWSGVGRVGQARHRRERRAAAGAGLRGASGSPHGSPGAASGPSRVGGSPRSRCSASLLELDSNRRSKQFVSRDAGFAGRKVKF